MNVLFADEFELRNEMTDLILVTVEPKVIESLFLAKEIN